MAQDVTGFFPSKTIVSIQRVVVFIRIDATFIIVQGSAVFHMFLINLDQGFVMKLILFKDLKRFVRVGVIQVWSVKFFNIQLSLILGLKPVT